MTRPVTCPACHAPTRKAYRPNLLDPGDVEPFEWCTTCGWDTDTFTALPTEIEHHDPENL